MRVKGLAFVGLVVGAFFATQSNNIPAVSATAVSSLDRFFSSDGPDSLHEAKNAGTSDEPKAWPEANAWLHAQLSESEKEFLVLSTTGSIPSGASTTGGFTSAQLADTTASLQLTLRFFFSSSPVSNFQTQLQSDIATTVTGVTVASVSVSTGTLVQVGKYGETLYTLTFSPSNTASAGTQVSNFLSAFLFSSSPLRSTSSFGYIDYSYYVQNPVYLPVNPTQSANYCASHANPCQNGGTCYQGASSSTYVCGCASGFIGTTCGSSLGAAAKGKTNANSGSIAGKSFTRPHSVQVVKPKPHQA